MSTPAEAAMASIGDYELEAPIATGAFATVWRGRRRGRVPQAVAVKRVTRTAPPEAVEALRREAELLGSLDHPHLMRILDVVDDDGAVAVVMPLAPGGSLAGLLEDRGRLAPGEAVAVLAPVADALASAHRRGVVHGDVKPANILFTSDGEPLLSDFGIARRLHSPATGWAGTPPYLAPEVAQGATPDERADVYGLGAVLHEVLTGSPPPYGPASSPRPPDGIASSLTGALRRALAAQPEERFASASELARELRGAVPPGQVVLPGPATAASSGAHPTRNWGPRPQRRRLPQVPKWVAAVGVVAVVLGLAGALLRPQRDDPPACPDQVADGPQVVKGDFRGDGCVRAARWIDNVLTVDLEENGPARHLRLGRPGDQLLVGDWDCDRDETPALYRPTTGAVLYFDDWPPPGGSLDSRPPQESGVVNGRARVEQGAAPECARVVVDQGGP
ncbi:MAG: serine/threonine protein kinase [Actinobacteria bacterium]|nr:serine/threonine protein kinase [Actinomycetota bacterium]